MTVYRREDRSGAGTDSESAGASARVGSTTEAGQLPAEVRAPMESSFGQSFADVKVHADSDRASGSTLALAQGNDIHFAPGQFRPGTESGNWLIAHELAHVTQQRGGGQFTQPFKGDQQHLLLERDADGAADRAVRGQPAEVQLKATAETVSKFEAYEHYKAGEKVGGPSVTTYNNVTLTYPLLCAMGDFFASPEDLMSAPAAELSALRDNVLREVALVDKEKAEHGETKLPKGAGAEMNNAYEDATSWRTANEGKMPEGGGSSVIDMLLGRGKGGGTSSKGSYMELNKDNTSHYAKETKAEYMSLHKKALLAAQDFWKAHNPDKDAPATAASAPKTNKETGFTPTASSTVSQTTKDTNPETKHATDTSGKFKTDTADGAHAAENFAAHYLQDCWASGHWVSGALTRAQNEFDPGGKDAKDKNAEAVKKSEQLTERMKAFADSLVPILLDSAEQDLMGEYSPEKVLAATGMEAGSSLLPIDTAALKNAAKNAALEAWQACKGKVTGALRDFLKNNFTLLRSAFLKVAHDTYNETGITVMNGRGDQFKIVGDDQLMRKAAMEPGPIQAGKAALEEAQKISLAEVEQTVKDGRIPAAFAAEAYIPFQAIIESKKRSIQDWGEDPDVIMAGLEPAKQVGPDNQIWKLAKGNVSTIVNEEFKRAVYKAIKAVGMNSAGKRAKETVNEGIEKAKETGHEIAEATEKKVDEGIALVRGFADRVVSKGKELKQDGLELVAKGKEEAKSLWNLAGDKIGELEKKAKGAWETGVTTFEEKKQQIGEWLGDRRADVTGKVAELVSKLFGENKPVGPENKDGVASKDEKSDAYKLDNQTYAHGAFMGAAVQMMQNPTWRHILEVLMPGDYQKAAAATAPAAIMAILENNPVLGAYGSAQHLREASGQKAGQEDPKTGKPIALEWDAWLDPKEPANLSLVRIAHGNTGTTVGQALDPSAPIGLSRDDVKGAPTGPGWMEIFGRAIAMYRGGDAVKSGGEAKAKDDKLKQAMASPTADQAIGLCKEFLQAPGGLILDIKSTYSTADQVYAFVEALRSTHGINVIGVGSWTHSQLEKLQNDPELKKQGFKTVKFFHGLAGLHNAAEAGRKRKTAPSSAGGSIEQNCLESGDQIMFNIGAIMSKQGAAYVIDEAQEGNLRTIKDEFKLSIGVYVQESAVAPAAVQEITAHVNSTGIYDMGFAYGNVNAHAEGTIGEGTGLGAQDKPDLLDKAKSLAHPGGGWS
jgi:hypothetical protein